MKTLEINVKKRDSLGKKSTRKLRSEGNVPCVMYGGEEVIHFYAPENSFRDLVYTHHVHMVIFNIDGKKYKAIIKEIQFHPVTDKILHMDFIETADNKPAIVDIPVELTGNSVGKLLIAGIIPGLIGAAMIIAMVAIRCKLDPSQYGYSISNVERTPWKTRFA